MDTSCGQWFMLVVLTFRRLRWKDCKFEASLGYIARSYRKEGGREGRKEGRRIKTT